MFCKKDSGTYRTLLEGVQLKTRVHGDHTLMGEFRFDRGARIPSHSHPHEQTGILISGKLRFEVDGDTFDAEAGDSWNIAGGIAHAAEALEDSVVVEVFTPVREDYLP